MAEKEERILITKCPGECEHLWYKDSDQGFPYGANKPLNNFYCAEGVKDWTKEDRSQKTKLVKPSIDCKNCKQAKYHGITRQEAIERMAKARYSQSPCYDARGNKVSFEDFREDYEPCYEDLIKEIEPLLNALLNNEK